MVTTECKVHKIILKIIGYGTVFTVRNENTLRISVR